MSSHLLNKHICNNKQYLPLTIYMSYKDLQRLSQNPYYTPCCNTRLNLGTRPVIHSRANNYIYNSQSLQDKLLFTLMLTKLYISPSSFTPLLPPSLPYTYFLLFGLPCHFLSLYFSTLTRDFLSLSLSLSLFLSLEGPGRRRTDFSHRSHDIDSIDIHIDLNIPVSVLYRFISGTMRCSIYRYIQNIHAYM